MLPWEQEVICLVCLQSRVLPSQVNETSLNVDNDLLCFIRIKNLSLLKKVVCELAALPSSVLQNQNLHFNKVHCVFLCTLKFESHWYNLFTRMS